ncbi:MAG: REP-associated tyrosine transposase [Thermoanaerobaculia bacterium]
MSIDRRAYRRRLPHYQSDHKDYFVTLCTQDRWVLPDAARDITLEHLVRVKERFSAMLTTIVMPDHVHIVMSPLERPNGMTYDLADILHGIKGVTGRRINRCFNRIGPVWQHESWDHELRNDESVRQKSDYVANNPVRAGLVEKPEDYPWLWRQWIDDEEESESKLMPDVAPALKPAR